MAWDNLEVYLDAEERQEAIDAGIATVQASLRDSHSIQLSYEERIRTNILGRHGERAVTKAFGYRWDPKIGSFKRVPDVGGLLDVRAQAKMSQKFSLCLHPDDPDHRPYIQTHPYKFRALGPELAEHEYNVVLIRGWMFGREAKRQEWWRSLHPRWGPAWFVPPWELRDILADELRELVEQTGGAMPETTFVC